MPRRSLKQPSVSRLLPASLFPRAIVPGVPILTEKAQSQGLRKLCPKAVRRTGGERKRGGRGKA